MAKPEKHGKPSKVHLSSEDDEDFEESKPVVRHEAKQEQIELKEEEPAPRAVERTAVKVVPVVVPKVEEPTLVTINMFVDVDPAPTVGHPAHGGYSFPEHGIAKLEARKSYVVPANAAAHLVDRKMCSVVG